MSPLALSAPIDLSVNNLLVGDNLVGLEQLVQHQAEVDLIYIDPPYNTQNSFSYHDARSPQGWQDFMRPRLNYARVLLKTTGVMFISIDDSSLYDLKLLMDQIFGPANFLGTFITKQAVRSNARHINKIHEYVIAYAKDHRHLEKFKIKRLSLPADAQIIHDLTAKVKQCFDSHGHAAATRLLKQLNAHYQKKYHLTWLRNYSEVSDTGAIFFPQDLSVPGKPARLFIPALKLTLPALATRKWSSPDKITSLHHRQRLHFKNGRPYEIHYLAEACDNVSSILDFYSRQGTNDLVKLGLRGLFDTPKPVDLIKYLIRIATSNNSHAQVLDFFAGSGTTAQAVLELNQEDQSNHRFCLIQLPESVSIDSEAYQFCLAKHLTPTIDQLTLTRIRAAYRQLGLVEDFVVTTLPSNTTTN